MNTLLKSSRIFIVAACFLVLLFLCGCSLLTTATPSGVTTSQVTLVTTNTTTTAVTNAVTGTIELQTTIALTTNVVVVTTTNYVYAASAGAQAVLSGGQAVAPLVPAPYGTALSALLGLLAAALGVFVRKKNHENLNLKQTVDAAGTLVQVIEQLHASQPSLRIKEQIAEATPDAKYSAVNKLVQSVTG